MVRLNIRTDENTASCESYSYFGVKMPRKVKTLSDYNPTATINVEFNIKKSTEMVRYNCECCGKENKSLKRSIVARMDNLICRDCKNKKNATK